VQRSDVRPFVCPVGILIVTHQGAACDAARVHFGPTVGTTDILFNRKMENIGILVSC